MRTTLTIEDSIDKKLKDIAHQSKKSFKQVVNETLARGLANADKPSRKFKVKASSLGEPRGQYEINKSLSLSDALEDDSLLRKLEQRK